MLSVAAAVLVSLSAPVAQAQNWPSCQTCSASTSHCGDPCQACAKLAIRYPDGSCSEYVYTTCGGIGSPTYNRCLRDGCTPNFVETSRSNRGTYADNFFVYCEHHRVDWVTKVDANQCNVNSTLWTLSSCDDRKDGYKAGTGVDCCDGSSATFVCDHHHSC